jgi:hypothetical protein
MSPGSDNDGRSERGQRDPEANFAELLNGFSLDSGRRKRRHRAPDEDEQERWEEPVEEQAPPPPPPAPEPALFEDEHAGDLPHPVDEFSEGAAIVRPYAWTQGRTKASVYLQMETLVSTSERVVHPRALAQLEHRAVAELCRHPHAVAEVAAKLSVPLGVARVLLSDMADQGMIVVHQPAAEEDDATAQLMLMERVLSGLRRL